MDDSIIRKKEEKIYRIKNVGCDDLTVSDVWLTDEELATLMAFSEINNKNSECRCQPSIHIFDKTTGRKLI